MREGFNPPAFQTAETAICAMQEHAPLVILSTYGTKPVIFSRLDPSRRRPV
jgi:hypothetical protein